MNEKVNKKSRRSTIVAWMLFACSVIYYLVDFVYKSLKIWESIQNTSDFSQNFDWTLLLYLL